MVKLKREQPNLPKSERSYTDTLLITFLKYSSELREFCRFIKVPDDSKFICFKQDFLIDLQAVFIEAFVTENNPKYANKVIKQLKKFKKSQGLDDFYDPYKATYGSMPTHAACNSDTFIKIILHSLKLVLVVHTFSV